MAVSGGYKSIAKQKRFAQDLSASLIIDFKIFSRGYLFCGICFVVSVCYKKTLGLFFYARIVDMVALYFSPGKQASNVRVLTAANEFFCWYRISNRLVYQVMRL